MCHDSSDVAVREGAACGAGVVDLTGTGADGASDGSKAGADPDATAAADAPTERCGSAGSPPNQHPLYELSGVIVHRGSSAGSGHYYSLCRVHDRSPPLAPDGSTPAMKAPPAGAGPSDSFKTRWRLCNDASVRVAMPETTAAAEGYVLMYVQRGE